MAMAACYPSSYMQAPTRVPPEAYQPAVYMKPRVPPTDYSMPLHVDCSVEYELPDCAKPPQGVKIEPLLMIHPCHFRNLERQRRRPFENNLPVKSPPLHTQKQQRSQPQTYSCEYSNGNNTHLVDYPSTVTSRYRGPVMRNHPYLPPCAPRCPPLPYAIQQHHPTLIYNV